MPCRHCRHSFLRAPVPFRQIVGDAPAVGWLLFFIAVSGLAVFIPWWSFRWVWQRRTESQLARLISRTDAALGDRLLGVIELDSEKHGRQYGSEKLKEAAMEQVAREVSAGT